MPLPAPQSYSPGTFRPLTFHDAVPGFLTGDDTPRAYLERCLETIAAIEPEVMAFEDIDLEHVVCMIDEVARLVHDATGAVLREHRLRIGNRNGVLELVPGVALLG